MEHYDVAVIGAGPAGAVFASCLSRLRPDLKVLLIDGQTENRKKVCGGLLAPDAQKVLSMFDLTVPRAVLSDPQIFDVMTMDLGNRCVRYYQRHYLNMDRYAFDRFLLSQVGEGVQTLEGRCVSIRQEASKVILTLRVGDRQECVSAGVVVGADGANSVVRRSCGCTAPEKYVAIQQHFDICDPTLPPYSCIFDAATSDRCSWTIRKEDRFIFGGAFRRKDCRKAFELQKARFENFMGVSLGEPMLTEACLVVAPSKMRDFCAGTGRLFLIGEAAGLISASSFEGISSAILSGKHLADAFARYDDPQQRLRAYSRNIQSLRLKLYLKIWKRRVLCSPWLRYLIMKSGIQSIKKYDVGSLQRSRSVLK